MEYLVTAEIEIDGNKIEHYTNITLRQKFNAHHQFIIRISHDVLETSGSFSLENAQKKIGKSALIRLKKKELSLEDTFEFRGIVCEVRMEQTGKSDADLVLIGYSPTILIENGQHLASFYNQSLDKIVDAVAKPLKQAKCGLKIKNQYKKPIVYICQYKESGFHFLNRLAADFSEFFYYDGKDLNFGKPDSPPTVDITYGEDIISMQMTLQAQPMNFSNYSYISKEDKVEKYDAPSNVNGMGQYASHVLKESNNLFSEPVALPVSQRVENKSDLENFVKKQKAAIAASLEVLTGTCYNPNVALGHVINVKVSKLQEISFVKEDYGKFLVTGIEHHVNENGKYYNTFEAIPSSIEVPPVTPVNMPVAEPQIAFVKDNKDPQNMGRVRVQMLWQKGNEMTDWIRVMTPDAGSGKGGGKNRGLLVIPEPGDQVIICFRYNDPDRPFVLGSMFHGKSGGGGGQGNNIKSLNSKSGHTITLDDGGGITIVDKSEGNKIEIDGTDKITITSSATMIFECGESKISMKKDGTIEITGKNITIDASTKAVMKSIATFTAEGTSATVEGTATEVKGKATVTVGSPATSVKGDAKLDLKSDAMVNVEGTAMTNVKGGVVNLN